MSLPVTFTFGNLPANYCFTTPTQFWIDLQALISATVANLSGINYGNAVPAPADQNKPWMRLNGDGTPDGFYVFNGVWERQHPFPPSSNARIIWMGTESDLWAYDGGDGTDPSSTPPTDTTGAMWVRDTAFGSDDGVNAFRVPIGIGKYPTGYDGGSPLQIGVGDLHGEQRHTLITSEIPPHQHNVVNTDTGDPSAPNLNPGNYITNYGQHAASSIEYLLCGSATVATLGLTALAGGGTSHNLLNPCIGVIFAKRSARKFITIT